MTPLVACLGGLAGAGAIEISELYGAVRSIKDFPWRHEGEVPLGPYLFSVILRLALGVIAAAVCSFAGPLSAVGAVAAGIAAPKLLEELGRHASTVSGQSPVSAVTANVPLQQTIRPAPATTEETADAPG